MQMLHNMKKCSAVHSAGCMHCTHCCHRSCHNVPDMQTSEYSPAFPCHADVPEGADAYAAVEAATSSAIEPNVEAGAHRGGEGDAMGVQGQAMGVEGDAMGVEGDEVGVEGDEVEAGPHRGVVGADSPSDSGTQSGTTRQQVCSILDSLPLSQDEVYKQLCQQTDCLSCCGVASLPMHLTLLAQ